MSINIDKEDFRNALFADWKSIAEHYIPYVARMDEYALCYIKDGYFICRCRANLTDGLNHYSSWLIVGKLYGYGTYEWIGKIKNPGSQRRMYLGFEKTHGWGDEGLAVFANVLGTYKTITYDDNGNEETQTLSGQDWTSDTIFKIEWTATYVKFYIDDILKTTHSTRVPTGPAHFLLEIGANHTPAPTTEPFCYVKENSFKEL